MCKEGELKDIITTVTILECGMCMVPKLLLNFKRGHSSLPRIIKCAWANANQANTQASIQSVSKAQEGGRASEQAGH